MQTRTEQVRKENFEELVNVPVYGHINEMYLRAGSVVRFRDGHVLLEAYRQELSQFVKRTIKKITMFQ